MLWRKIYLPVLVCCSALAALAQTPQPDSAAQALLSRMSLRQKVYEMSGHGIARFGASMVFSKKLKQVKAGGNKKLGIPPTVFNDGPRGLFHYKGATAFPVTMARGASWDTELEQRVGEAMAKEIRAVGGNYSGAVCMNLLRHPAWGRAQETYGEDPHHVGEMASALLTGIQKHHVQACVKHFAANSMENNRFGGSMNMSERTLHEVYLPHFKKTIERGAASVMSAYNKLNGEYCGHHRYLLTTILRQQWGFKGYVTSDWSYGLFDAQKGIQAGMNVEMPTGKVYRYNTIKRLMRQNKITAQQIDTLVFPILRTKWLFAARVDSMVYTKNLIGCKEHIALAREVAEKSAVLLKNENALLPLQKSAIKKVVLIGSLAALEQTGDYGSSHVFPSYIVSPFEGISQYLSGSGVQVVLVKGSDTVAIQNACRDADVVIAIAGTTQQDEGEYIGRFTIRDRNKPDAKSGVVKMGILGLGGDRTYLHLHAPDIQAIRAAAAVNKRVVVSLVAGAAITVEEWQSEVPAILQTFYNGMEGGTALARILFGEVNPGGKLPFTVPVNEGDLPPFDSFADTVHYGYYHGYTLFDKTLKPVRYPFGYGLSYTTFKFSNLQTDVRNDTCFLRLKVKNTGTVYGAEVVQAYVSPPAAEVQMPEKLLRAFAKVYLQPGEEKEIALFFPLQDLQYYDEEHHHWKLLKGEYVIEVGKSSATVDGLRSRFRL